MYTVPTVKRVFGPAEKGLQKEMVTKKDKKEEEEETTMFHDRSSLRRLTDV